MQIIKKYYKANVKKNLFPIHQVGKKELTRAAAKLFYARNYSFAIFLK